MTGKAFKIRVKFKPRNRIPYCAKINGIPKNVAYISGLQINILSCRLKNRSVRFMKIARTNNKLKIVSTVWFEISYH